MKYFKVTKTHNPQDFFNGIEPPELNETHWTANLERDVSEGLDGGFVMIVTELGDVFHADV